VLYTAEYSVVQHFSTTVRNFLKEFEEDRKKWNGNRLAPIMRTLRENGVTKFSHTELLTAQQIDSYSIRLARQLKTIQQNDSVAICCVNTIGRQGGGEPPP
jgi:hypothetical protein